MRTHLANQFNQSPSCLHNLVLVILDTRKVHVLSEPQIRFADITLIDTICVTYSPNPMVLAIEE